MSRRVDHVDHLKVDADELKDSAANVAANVADAAATAKNWAEPKVGDLVAWLRPHAENAWRESVKAAAPHVERLAAQAAPAMDNAAEKLVPAAQNAGIKVGEGITVAHDKVLEELLPRLVAVVNEAAKRHHNLGVVVEEPARGHHARKKPHKSGHKHAKREVVKLVQDATDHVDTHKHHHRGRKLLAASAAGVAVAGYTFWKRAQPKNDPWAEPWDQSKDADYSGTVKDAKYRVEEVADDIGEATGRAVSRGKELAEDVSERSADLREDLAEKAGELRDDLAERTADVRENAVKWSKDAAAKVTDVARDVEGKVEGLIKHRHDGGTATPPVDPDTAMPIAETVVSGDVPTGDVVTNDTVTVADDTVTVADDTAGDTVTVTDVKTVTEDDGTNSDYQSGTY